MLQIEALRKQRGLNMKEAAKALGMPYTTYVNYEKGQREPTSETLILLADFFNVSVDHILGRYFDSSKSKTEDSLLLQTISPSYARNSDYSDEEQGIIQKFRCLDARGKAAVLNVLNYEYESLPGEKAHTAPKEA